MADADADAAMAGATADVAMAGATADAAMAGATADAAMAGATADVAMTGGATAAAAGQEEEEAPKGPPPCETIDVVGLPSGLNDEQLKETFESYGAVVQCRMLPEPPGGAQVRFDSVETATWVVESLDGNIPQGLANPIRVKFAEQQGQGQGQGQEAQAPTAATAAAAAAAAAEAARGDPAATAAAAPAQSAAAAVAAQAAAVQAAAAAAAATSSPQAAAAAVVSAVEQLTSQLGIPQGALAKVFGQLQQQLPQHAAAAAAAAAAHRRPAVPQLPVRAPAEPSDNLYVSDLPPSFTDEQLKATFDAYGLVTRCRMLPPTAPGQTKGCALVRYDSVETASWVVQNLHGNIPQGLSAPVLVRFADRRAGGQGKGFEGNRYAPYPTGGGGGGFAAAVQNSAAAALAAAVVTTPSQTLLVSGLPTGLEQRDLLRLMEQYGNLASVKLLNSPPNAPKAGFVTFLTLEESTWVKENLNGGIPMGLSVPIKVDYADPTKGEQPAAAGGKGGGSFGAFGGGKGSGIFQKDNLYIRGLPVTTTEGEVRQIFSQYGSVVSVRVFRYQANQPSTALVRYATEEEAQWVLENLNGNVPQGFTDPVEVRFYEVKQPREVAPPFGGAPASGGAGDPGAATKTYWWQQAGAGPGAGAGAGAGGAAPGVIRLPGQQALTDGGKGSAGTDAWGKDGGGWGKAGGKGKGGKDRNPPPDYQMKVVTEGFENSGSLPGSDGPPKDAVLYVNGLPPDCEDVDLYRLFNPFGPIVPQGVKVMMTPDGTCRGYGFVNFLERKSAQAAIAIFNGTILPDGSTLHVKIKQQPVPPPKHAPGGGGGGPSRTPIRVPAPRGSVAAAAAAAAAVKAAAEAEDDFSWQGGDGSW